MANLKNTQIDNNLELPSGTTGERPASPQEGQIRYNTDLGTTEFYNGSNWRPLSDTNPEATGGTVVDTDIGGVPYRIHYFTETVTDTLTVTNPGEVEYLIVAGGGGGATRHGGAGGAGGLLHGKISLPAQSYSIVVGAGGNSSGTNANLDGQNGDNSSALGFTALGGGGGAGVSSAVSGGSGGGGKERTTQGGSALQPGSQWGGLGNPGGAGVPASPPYAGGGGGGAGSPGQDAISISSNDASGGAGGQGIMSDITGTNQFYAGGGGGSGDDANNASLSKGGAGGLGGGGSGRGGTRDAGNLDASNGVPNTGGGGGAAAFDGGTNGIPGNGGSGIVIIRYPRNSSLDSEPDRTTIATQPLNVPVPGRHFYNLRSTSILDYFYLDPPFDVENRQLIYSIDPRLESGISRVDNLALSNDGTILYLCATNDVLKYNLSRPFDIASAELDFRLPDFHSATEPTCFEFADNGKKFYDHQGTNGEMLQYELSRRYDIRTRTQTGSLGGFGNWGPGDPAFSPDGSRVAIGERSGSQIIRGGFCSTPFDISTYRQETTINPPDNDPSCCKWNGDGTTLYVRHASPDMVNEFSTPNPYSLVGMTFVQRVMPDTQFAAGGLHINYNF